MLRWRRAVATEPKLHMCIDADARLAAAAGGVARFLADAAGLEGDATTRLQSAVIEACLEAFESLSPADRAIQVRYALYADRIEIELAQAGLAVKRLTRHIGQTTANT